MITSPLHMRLCLVLGWSWSVLVLGNPPCPWNPRCSCSKSGPSDLGEVECDGKASPLLDIPSELNNTGVYTLRIQDNYLPLLPPNRLHGTGKSSLFRLWKLVVRRCGMREVSEEAFSGLHRSLWHLDLSYNRLSQIPTDSLAYLSKLRTLDLSGNGIQEVREEDLRSLNGSLEELHLGRNSILRLPQSAFRGLDSLKVLDLRDNNIVFIHNNAFTGGPRSLSSLILRGNLLTKIPFASLGSQGSNLDLLDVSWNLLQEPYDVSFLGTLSVGTLRLDYNLIKTLDSFAFQNFKYANVTHLGGNPLTNIMTEAFKDAKIQEIYLNDTDLCYVDEDAFDGLGDVLQVLFMDRANLTTLPQKLLAKLDYLHTLSLSENQLSHIPDANFNGFQFTLRHLDISGSKMAPINLENLKEMRNLRKVSMRLPLEHRILNEKSLLGLGSVMEELSLVGNALEGIHDKAFLNLPSLRVLDLSKNQIRLIHAEAFEGIGRSLQYLKLKDGIKSKSLEAPPFHSLTQLREFDLSRNPLLDLPDDFFLGMRNLRLLYLDHNRLTRWSSQYVAEDKNPLLEEIYVSFNALESIPSGAFANFQKLRIICFSDNRIQEIGKGAFAHLENLQFLDLRGNDLNTFVDDTFQNLPRLRALYVSYNRLTDLNLDSMDQVGNLESLELDASHNRLDNLSISQEMKTGWNNLFSIKLVNLSHNNISDVDPKFFQVLDESLLTLDLRYNALRHLNRTISGNKEYLDTLWLDHNQLSNMEPDSLEGSRDLQVLSLSHNQLKNIPASVFERKTRLRVLDISRNELKSIPDTCLRDNRLQVLRGSWNDFARVPDFSLHPRPSLRELDLSHNNIHTLRPNEILTLTGLIRLDLSHNKLVSVDEGTFATFHKIRDLDLSHNPLDKWEPDRFENLMDLESLNFASVGLGNFTFPSLPKLKFLNVSGNELESLGSGTSLGRVPKLESLDISRNRITELSSSAWLLLPNLKELRVTHNNVTQLLNNTLVGLQRLQLIDISHLHLDKVETGALEILPGLQDLRLSRWYPGLQLPASLEAITLDIRDSDLISHIPISFPFKTNRIRVHGNQHSITIPSSLLQGISSREVTLEIRGGGVNRVERDVLESLTWVHGLRVEIQGTNLTSFPDPRSSSSSHHPHRLLHLRIPDNKWICDCGIGWVEGWLTESEQPCESMKKEVLPIRCPEVMESLREVKCRSPVRESLMSALNRRLDCHSSASLPLIPFATLLAPAVLYWIWAGS